MTRFFSGSKGLSWEAITSPPCTALLCSAQPLSVVNRFQQTVHSKGLSREAVTSIPCTAPWWTARPLPVWNRLEQSVHWKGLDQEAITMWERKRSFSLLVLFIYISHVHAHKWPERGKSPTSSYNAGHTEYSSPTQNIATEENASFWRELVGGNSLYLKYPTVVFYIFACFQLTSLPPSLNIYE